MDLILLHACCGPCSIEPLRLLSQTEAKLALVFVNPNIHPQGEYQLRLAALRDYATMVGCTLITAEYQPEQWERAVGVFGGPYPIIPTDDCCQHNLLLRQKRCAACYRLRLSQTADLAVAEGYDTIGTTLTISPYQFTELIIEELKRAAIDHGLKALEDNYQDLFAASSKRSRELGMYNQRYCGCRFSEIEADLERAARKELRKQRRKQMAGTE
ncbi:MAG: epoxyqueuosine reductase QueH [Coriobacteriaceae bacterium]|nr:epoxyqueuosine reductase QueH [Coriobacteriaceae bacterium]